jgi:hypothetical protein
MGALLVAFSGYGCEALARLKPALLSRNGFAGLTVAASIAWLAIVPVVGALDLEWISQKFYSVSPMPRFDRSLVEVNEWLKERGAREEEIVIVADRDTAVGPWLSLVDGWYGTQLIDTHDDSRRNAAQLRIVRSPEDLLSVLHSITCGHFVFGAERASAYLDGEVRRQISEQPSFKNERYTVFRGGKGCRSTSGEGGARR